MKVNPLEPEGEENPQNSLPLRGYQNSVFPNSLSLSGGMEKLAAEVSSTSTNTQVGRITQEEFLRQQEAKKAAIVAEMTKNPSSDETLIAPAQLDLKALGRQVRLRVEAASHARQAVRQQALHEKRFFSREDRERREAIAKFQFFWRSGEPVLQREATEWATAHPEDLPEALPAVAPEVLAVAPEVPLPAVEVPPVVGDCVVWDNCPGHCAWMNPFRITAIEGDMVRLDFYENLVPLSQLRRCSNG
jgi:hypothetical protein